MSNFLLNPILGANGIRKDDTISDKITKLGENTGNMVFVNAIKEQIPYEKEDWISENMEFNDSYTYVLPCSNFLQRGAHWIEPLTDIIEKHPIRVVMIGLGAKAKISDRPRDLVYTLSEKQKRFFQVLSERCVSIGVRGEFTADCLNLLGIKNSVVIGCPSMYKYLDGTFPHIGLPSFENMIITVTPGRKNISSGIVKIGIENNAKWIMQSKGEIISLYSFNKVLRYAQQCMRFPNIQWNKIKNYQENNARIFWEFREWNKFIQDGRFSFAFGSRFHGNMMALRNGVPTLWVVHDMRTMELVQAMKVPGITEEMIYCTPPKLLELCDYSDFYKFYEDNLKKYILFLKENDVQFRNTI